MVVKRRHHRKKSHHRHHADDRELANIITVAIYLLAIGALSALAVWGLDTLLDANIF